MKRTRQLKNGSNYEKAFSWLVFLLFLAATCLNSFGKILHREFLHASYQSWEISEWLINYEGGFVRRGLTGQLLWSLQQWFPYDIRVALMGICIIASAVFLCLILRVFKKEGWSLLIIPTGFCLGFTLFNLWGRRDYISLMLTFSLFLLYRHVLRHPRQWLAWVAFYILSALQLLMHEASFFYTFPILMLYGFHHHRGQHLSITKSLCTSALQFLPVVLVMGAACIFKGNENVAQAIWDSWVPVVGRYQADVSKMGWGVFALTWSPEMIFPSHFSTSLMGDASPAVWRIPLVLLNLLAGYYLVTRLNAVDMGLYRPKTMNHVMMSNVALIQFVAMLPMFTVLSCDWGRTIPYWVISSLMFYYVFRQEPTTFASPLTSMSSRIQEKSSKSKVLSSPYTYILLVLLAPVPTYNAPLDHVNTFQQRFFTIILDMFNQLASLFS